MNHFENLELTFETIDVYHTRRSIYEALRKATVHFRGTFLDIGCGQMPYKSTIQPYVNEYIGLDLDNDYSAVKPDMYWDGNVIPLDAETIDSAIAIEVFEHVPDLNQLLSEAKRVLKPGGVLFFTVPFLWPLHDVPYDEFRYTPFALEREFTKNGFEIVKFKSLGGWNASLAQMLGLWLKRSNIPYFGRRIGYFILYPFYQLLLRSDKVDDNFIESNMITGISGIVRKKI
ncbi:class I SAM-dependent methyltransferase [Pontibacter toksunensis]|uniref:Class I SAM-dependent methyltransferase n=1 Tax=Pontibacter toksunensis TaxID=1332631 RepID=A0ABW6BNQ7_9BACT